MTEEQVRGVIVALQPFLDKLGVTSEYIWQVYLKQAQLYAVAQMISVVAYIVGGAAIIGLTVWLTLVGLGKASLDYAKKYDDWMDNRRGKGCPEDMCWTVLAAGVLATVILPGLWLWLVSTAMDTYLRLMNPDYYALQEILTRLGGLKK